MSDDLSRCPWCGRTPVVSSKMFRSASLGRHEQFAVRCAYSECKVRPQTHWFLEEQAARDAWNNKQDFPK